MSHQMSGKEAQAALREQHWRRVEASSGMLTDTEVEALPVAIRNDLIGVARPDGIRFPRFQIVRDGGVSAIPPAWQTLRDLLAPAQWSEENLLMWTLSPNAYLEGDSPAKEVHAHPTDVTPRLRYAVERAIPRTKTDRTDNGLAF